MDGAIKDLSADVLRLAKRMATEAPVRHGISEAIEDENGVVHIYVDGVWQMMLSKSAYEELHKHGPVLP